MRILERIPDRMLKDGWKASDWSWRSVWIVTRTSLSTARNRIVEEIPTASARINPKTILREKIPTEPLDESSWANLSATWMQMNSWNGHSERSDSWEHEIMQMMRRCHVLVPGICSHSSLSRWAFPTFWLTSTVKYDAKKSMPFDNQSNNREWRVGWMQRWIQPWMDGWMDGRLDGWMDGWMDKWMDGGWIGNRAVWKVLTSGAVTSLTRRGHALNLVDASQVARVCVCVYVNVCIFVWIWKRSGEESPFPSGSLTWAEITHPSRDPFPFLYLFQLEIITAGFNLPPKWESRTWLAGSLHRQPIRCQQMQLLHSQPSCSFSYFPKNELCWRLIKPFN